MVLLLSDRSRAQVMGAPSGPSPSMCAVICDAFHPGQAPTPGVDLAASHPIPSLIRMPAAQHLAHVWVRDTGGEVPALLVA